MLHEHVGNECGAELTAITREVASAVTRWGDRNQRRGAGFDRRIAEVGFFSAGRSVTSDCGLACSQSL